MDVSSCILYLCCVLQCISAGTSQGYGISTSLDTGEGQGNDAGPRRREWRKGVRTKFKRHPEDLLRQQILRGLAKSDTTDENKVGLKDIGNKVTCFLLFFSTMLYAIRFLISENS